MGAERRSYVRSRVRWRGNQRATARPGGGLGSRRVALPRLMAAQAVRDDNPVTRLLTGLSTRNTRRNAPL